MPHIHLVGGEQDGQLIPNATKDETIYYAVPLVDDSKIKSARGKKKEELRAVLGTLAYRFQREVVKDGIGVEYVYVRAPQLDKKAPAK